MARASAAGWGWRRSRSSPSWTGWTSARCTRPSGRRRWRGCARRGRSGPRWRRRGPLAPLTAGAVLDRRVRAVISDVADVIARARPGQYHAIILDLYEGPHAAAQRPHDPLYGREALARAHAALAPGGVLTVWTEESNLAFKRRMLETGFATRVQHPGGSRAYAVYVGQKAEAEGPAKAGAGRRPTSQGAGPRRQGSPPRTSRARR